MELIEFLRILYPLITRYFYEEVDPTLKPIDSADCLSCRNTPYDFIIVGAGSAGCVLANRLSVNPEWKVLLIEAGGDEDYITDTPALHQSLKNKKYDWNYTTIPQKYACANDHGQCAYPRGHVMGGSSTINSFTYSRGTSIDYDEWEAMGNAGWGYKDVLPYFLKLENMTIPELKNSPYHSTKGPLSVGYPFYTPCLTGDFFDAGIEQGLKSIDYNGKEHVGISVLQKTIKIPTRCSASKAYLDPIRNRTNLVIFKNTLVTKILLNEFEGKAVGVSCLRNGGEYNMYSSKEVIVSAGAINTPKLLMLSGIGPKDHLEELGIPVHLDLPAVGSNLADHPLLTLRFEIDESEVTCKEDVFSHDSALKYAKDRSGPLTAIKYDMIMLMNRNNSSEFVQDIHLNPGPDTYSFNDTRGAHMSVLLAIVNVNSLGTVRLASKKYQVPPLIDPNYYSDPQDLYLAMWGVKQVFKYINSPILAKYSPKWDLSLAPPCNCYDTGSDEHLLCYIKYTSVTYSHASGTARMGPANDTNTVVDDNLRVRSISQLRVVDASVMPRIVRGTTNAPTIMIAEKAADLIKQSYTD